MTGSGTASINQERIHRSYRRGRRGRRARGRRRFRKTNVSPQKNGQQRGDRRRVETLPGKILNDANGFVGIVRLLIRTVRRQSVEGVGYRDHAWQKRNVVTLES